MTIKKSFVKPVAMLFCALILTFSLSHAVDGQNGQLKGATEDYVIVEGDMKIPRSLFERLQFEELQAEGRAPQAALIRNDIHIWPGGIVPFEFDSNVTPENRIKMEEAMAVLEAEANVDFRHCPNDDCGLPYTHKVVIQNGDGNNSSVVGMADLACGLPTCFTSQGIEIASWNSKFTIVHELLHCLGFFHEQNRSNRDNYVKVNCDYVQGGCGIFSRHRLDFVIDDTSTGYGYYDFDSVMHYDQCAFSIDCPDGSTCACTNRTITVLPPNDTQWQGRIGQRNHLSVLDKASLSFLYPASDWRFVDTFYDGARGSSNGTFLRPYSSFSQAVSNTPEGGTVWLLRTQTIPAAGTYSKRITVKTAPGVEATLVGG